MEILVIVIIPNLLPYIRKLISEFPKTANVKHKLEKHIDQLVYKLYDLTEEEIKIVEGNLKSI